MHGYANVRMYNVQIMYIQTYLYVHVNIHTHIVHTHIQCFIHIVLNNFKVFLIYK